MAYSFPGRNFFQGPEQIFSSPNWLFLGVPALFQNRGTLFKIEGPGFERTYALMPLTTQSLNFENGKNAPKMHGIFSRLPNIYNIYILGQQQQTKQPFEPSAVVRTICCRLYGVATT